MNKPKQTISDEVMNKIKHGDIKMKPRVYFTALSTLATFAVLIAGLAVSYLSTIIFYWIRVETSSTMAYGARRNLNEAIADFPWWTVIIAMALIVLAVTLVRRHGTLYRHRASTVAIIIILLSIVVGLIMYSVGLVGPDGSRHNNPGSERRGQSWQQDK